MTSPLLQALPVLAQDVVLAQVVLAQDTGAGFPIVPIVLVFLIFYFIVIRPSGRERRQREEQLKALKKHDRVVTNAGIHGTVVALEDDAVILRVDDKNNVRMKFTRSAVWQVLGGGSTEEVGSTPAKTAS